MNATFFWSKIVPVLCMLSLSIGQILFKIVAQMANETPIQSSPRAMLLLAGSLLLYAVTTLAWIGALRYVPLGRAYPIIALAYVFVPLGSILFLGEQVSSAYWGGVLLILAGLALIGQSQVTVS